MNSNFAEALASAKAHVLSFRSAVQLELDHSKTTEYENGWWFFYNSAEAIRTRYMFGVLDGAAGFFVWRELDKITSLGTMGGSVENQVRAIGGGRRIG